MKPRPTLFALLFILATAVVNAAAQTPPPAPALISPTNGATLAQPMTLRWSAVSDPDGPIESYLWQVGTTSSFSLVIASGFTDARNGDPIPTQDRLSGLPNATYFWRVKATQNVGGAVGFIESAWSSVQTFTINGLGPAPGTSTITGPGNGSRFHPYEFYKITWTEVPGAQYYMLEADDEPSFSYPQTLTLSPMEFGTGFEAGWGNEIPNIYYRVRAVSVDNVRGLPSAVVNVKIVNTAPVPAAPTPLSPSGGATVSLPFKFDWTDTANPQIPGYDIDVDDEPTFSGTFGVLLVQDISRSDYTLVSDLPPGTYYWRVRAVHGNTRGPWSAGVSFRVVAGPPTPPGLGLFWLNLVPSSVAGAHSTQARVTLNAPAPSGGALVRVASDLPHVEVPEFVTIPAGSTDAIVSPITSIPVHATVVGTVRAAYGASWQQNSIGLWPLLVSLSLDKPAVVGGNTVTGKLTLLTEAPANGIDVTLVSSDTSLVRPPATVTVPGGATSVSFPIATSTVAASALVTLDTGTANDHYRAPLVRLTLLPAGSPAPPPALSSVTLATPSVLGGGTTTGTVTLTGPAPPGGALVWVNGSMEGNVITNGGVTVPAGQTSASFPVNAGQTWAQQWVMVQASYGGEAGMHMAVLRIDPAQPAIPDLYAMGLDGVSTLGGGSLRGTVGLVTPAPPGGTTVSLSSSDPSVASVPSSVQIGGGNSAGSFTISTSASVSSFQSVQITAQSGAGVKSEWISVYPDPNAVVLSSITPNTTTTTGGNSISTTLFLSGNSGPSGARVTLSSSNTAAAQVPASVTVPAGQGWVIFNITTSPVSADTPVTITGTYGATKSAIITVLGGGGGGGGTTNTGLRSPTANAADSAGDGNGFESSPGSAMADDASNAVDNNSGTASSTSCTSTARDKHRFFNYGITLPSGATVKGIEVRLDARVDDTSGSPRMCVELSWDGGVSWTTPLATSTLSKSMASRTLGGAANTWGRTWTPAELSNANFRVRITNVANSTSRDFTLDWVAVRVSY